MSDTKTNAQMIQEIKKHGDPGGSLAMALWLQNSGLVRKAVKAYAGRIEEDDARQECFCALLEAVDGYDAAAGVAFSTFFYNIMRWRLYSYCGKCSSVTVPDAARGALGRYKKIVRQYYQAAGREPTDDEAAALLGVSLDQVDGIRRAAAAEQPLYLDTPFDDGSGDGAADLYDIIPDTAADTEGAALDELHDEQRRAAVREALNMLPEDERKALYLHHAAGLTYQEAAERMGSTADEVRAALARGKRHIRTGKPRRVLDGVLPRSDVYGLGLRGGSASFAVTWTSSTERTALLDLGERQGA